MTSPVQVEKPRKSEARQAAAGKAARDGKGKFSKGNSTRGGEAGAASPPTPPTSEDLHDVQNSDPKTSQGEVRAPRPASGFRVGTLIGLALRGD